MGLKKYQLDPNGPDYSENPAVDPGHTHSGGGPAGGSGFPGTYTALTPLSQIQPANNSVYYEPLYFGASVLTSLSTRVTIAGDATSVVRLGIYADAGGIPGALIADAGTVSSASTGYKTISGLSIPLAAGTYWIAVSVQGVLTLAPNIQSATPPSQVNFKTVTNGGVGILGWSQTGVSGALPGNVSSSVTEEGTGILLGIAGF